MPNRRATGMKFHFQRVWRSWKENVTFRRMWWSCKHWACYFPQLSSLKNCFFLVLLLTLDNIVVTNVSQPFSAALLYWCRWLLYFITCPYRSMSAFLMSLFPICKRLMKTTLCILIRLWHSKLHSSKTFLVVILSVIPMQSSEAEM